MTLPASSSMTEAQPNLTSLSHCFAAFAAGPGAAGAFAVENPATGDVIVTLQDLDVPDALDALDSAKDSALAWAATSARQRSEVLSRAFELMTRHENDLAELISLENGKSRADALGEVRYAAEYFRWYAEEVTRVRGEYFQNPTGTSQVIVSYEPVGVCLLVTPWNFPAAMITRKIGPAIAAGCTVIVKPAAETPLTAIVLGQLLREAGLPEGVVSIIPTTKASVVVRALMAADEVRLLSFTGSTEVGRTLLAAASRTVMKTTMELGGNAPFLVFDDADVDAAVEGAMIAKMRNGGQACTAANRFYVHDSVYDVFVERFVERMRAVRLGNPADAAVECGPLINEASVEKAQRLVDDAVARGAQLLIGGERSPLGPNYYPPTVLVDVSADAEILREEVFAPVAPVVRFSEEDDIILQANDTVHGLVSYLYTADLARGFRVVRRLEAGMVALNRGLVSDPAAPFGGVKQSGLGREGSHDGIAEYLEPKYLATNW